MFPTIIIAVTDALSDDVSVPGAVYGMLLVYSVLYHVLTFLSHKKAGRL